ncbi:hypothetical protein OF83DRAFT_1058199 [Amylostereum chailletii]|nr:hypothetical protein OF83DRAFT_1058199 [Amylostereum chailletii]
MIWDALCDRIFQSRPYLFLVEADAIGATELHGYVGHHGKQGCRERCGVVGRRKPGQSHYYAVSLKPDDYYEAGCDHDDIEPSDIQEPQSEQEYLMDLRYIIASRTEREYAERRLSTGLSKPSLFLGLSPRHRLAIPGLFCGDIMHTCGLNLSEVIWKLLRGSFKCDTANGDSKDTWS